MKPYQERVIAEKHGLDSKIESLTTFISARFFESLDDAEQSRMRIQLSIMQAYATTKPTRLTIIAENLNEQTS